MKTRCLKIFKATKPIAISIVLLSCVSAYGVEGSWLIDEERYHMSVHGQIPCLECHDGIQDKDPHPDPSVVNKSVADFYRVEQCVSCHEEILENMDGGGHGDGGMDDEAKLHFCIGCHDPHYQLRLSFEAVNSGLNQPSEERCALCHEYRKTLPKTASESQQCLNCHRQILSNGPEVAIATAALCFYCHGSTSSNAQNTDKPRPLINTADYASTPHSAESCLSCHPRAASFQHAEQPLGDCNHCHHPHDEKTLHEAHSLVSCGACHLSGIIQWREPDSGQILWKTRRPADGITHVHDMQRLNEKGACRGCHFKGNDIGVAGMVLPPKSVICIPCHTATLALGDPYTLFALAVFCVGMLGLVPVWLSGAHRGGDAFHNTNRILPAFFRWMASIRMKAVITALVMDGLLLRRLFRADKLRWTFHALVFFPFLFRFFWGVSALFFSLCIPEHSIAWVMVDKNHPLTAFLFDLSGVLIFGGLASMIVHRIRTHSKGVSDGLPSQDWIAYGLLGGLLIVGFVLEGMRIAMFGDFEGVAWSFVGSRVGSVLQTYNFTNGYGYVWYLHAILTGAFVAYLPFSSMVHMIMAPVALILHAGTGNHKK